MSSNVSKPISEFDHLNNGMVSAQTFKIVYAVTSYASYPVLILGFLFGFFSVVIYSRKKTRSVTGVFLVALNLAEMSCGISVIVGRLFGPTDWNAGTYVSFTTMIYTTIYLKTSFRRSTYCYSCLVSAERCIALVFPLRATHFRLVRYPFVAALLTLLASLVAHAFTLFKYEVISLAKNDSNVTVWRMEFSTWFKAHENLFTKFSLLSQTVFVYLPLFFCLFFNIVTAASLRKHEIRRRKLFESGAHESGIVVKERNTTIIVLVSTFVLVFLALPMNIIAIVSTFGDTEVATFRREHYLYGVLANLAEFLEYLINCTGFIFYMTISRKFRAVFTITFCRPCKTEVTERFIQTANSSMRTSLDQITTTTEETPS